MSNPYKAERPAPPLPKTEEVGERQVDERVPRVVFFVPDVGDLVLSGVDEEVGPVISEVTPEMRETLVAIGGMIASVLQTGRLEA